MAVMGTAVSATGALCAFDSLTQLEEYKRKQVRFPQVLQRVCCFINKV